MGFAAPLSFKSEEKNYTLQQVDSLTYKLLTWENNYEGLSGRLVFHSGHIQDFAIHSNSLWTVSGHLLTELNLETGEFISQYKLLNAKHFSNKAKGLAILNDKMYIARGNLGVDVFSLKEKKLIGNHTMNTVNGNGRFSHVTDITVNKDGLIYASLAMASPEAFTGIITFDPETNSIINKAHYLVRRVGVVSPYSRIYSEGNKVFLNNQGWVHILKESKVQKKSKIVPKWRGKRAKHKGRFSYLMIKGDLNFINGRVVGCSSLLREDEKTGELYKKVLPVSIKY